MIYTILNNNNNNNNTCTKNGFALDKEKNTYL